MPEAELWAKCDACNRIKHGNLKWVVEDGVDILNQFSLLFRILQAHHGKYSLSKVHHQVFHVYRSENGAKNEDPLEYVGHINMSAECGGTAVLD